MSNPRYIAHTSGKQPVGDDERVAVVLRCGRLNERVAYFFNWRNTGWEYDIIAYRVIKE